MPIKGVTFKGGSAMLPKIGITSHVNYSLEALTLGKYYIRAVEKSGGVPFVIPCVRDGDIIARYCNVLDGLLFTGGDDISPDYFGEEPKGTRKITPERDAFEILLARKYLLTGKPILGICRGLQLLNIAAGGSIYQDIDTEIEDVVKHMQEAPGWYASHSVVISKGTLLEQVYLDNEIRVNSFHHQAIRDLAPAFHVSARALDGVVEAVESPGHRFLIGVQWHPEKMIFNSISLRLFEIFVEAAGLGN